MAAVSLLWLLLSLVALCRARATQPVRLAGPASPAPAEMAFLSIGDWGAQEATLRGYAVKNGAAMAQFIGKHPTTAFVISVGDNVYPYGTMNTTDPSWQTTFFNVFNATALVPLKWYGVLGNHDYVYSPQSQVDFTTSPLNKGRRWNMPARNYVQRFLPAPGAPHNVTIIYFDANPCLLDYRQTEDPTKWKPQNKNDDPDYNFNGNIRAEPCQDEWLQLALNNTDRNDWLLVVAHEPVHAIDAFPILALLDKYMVHLYIHGHSHRLSAYTYNKRYYVDTGAGSMDEDDTDTTNPYPPDADILFEDKKTPGFTGHFFDSNYAELHTHYFDMDGNTLYKFVVTK